MIFQIAAMTMKKGKPHWTGVRRPAGGALTPILLPNLRPQCKKWAPYHQTVFQPLYYPAGGRFLPLPGNSLTSKRLSKFSQWEAMTRESPTYSKDFLLRRVLPTGPFSVKGQPFFVLQTWLWFCLILGFTRSGGCEGTLCWPPTPI